MSIGLKAILLTCLVLQNALFVVFARWANVARNSESGPPLAKTTIVLVCEAIKTVLAFVFFGVEHRTYPVATIVKVNQETMSKLKESSKLLVPSALYVVQNNLVLIAANHLEAPLLSVLGQAKILTTALFSILFLGKQLDCRQWVALLMLFIGVCTVQLSQMDAKSGRVKVSSDDLLVGLPAVAVACIISGFASVYFESLLKGSDTSVWLRNIHMSAVGIVFSLAAMHSESSAVIENGFFAGYNGVVWGFIIIQAGGGLLVALVVKHTDNIVKGFASSVAIVGTSVISIVFFDFTITETFFIGACCVIYATLLYGDMLQTFRVCSPCPRSLGGPEAKKSTSDLELL